MHAGIVSNTKVGKERAVKMGHMAGLIEKTQGEGVNGILSGVLVDTKPTRMKKVDSVMKSHDPKPKTTARSMGQVPYSGKMY